MLTQAEVQNIIKQVNQGFDADRKRLEKLEKALEAVLADIAALKKPASGSSNKKQTVPEAK